MKDYKIPKWIWWKRWFDTGLGLTNYAKYPLVLFGIAEITLFKSYKFIVIIGILYTIFCFFAGWFWLKHGFFEAEMEISNQLNPFVKEMRNGKIFKEHGIRKNVKIIGK